MLLSIIIPVFNVEKYIKKCLKSILDQVDNEAEIIIIDDGSTDNSIQIAKTTIETTNTKGNIVILKELNGGQGKARNYGVKKSQGKYITFVDSDDYVSNNWYKVIKEHIQGNKNPEVIVFDAYESSDNGYYIRRMNMTNGYNGIVKVDQHPELLLWLPAVWNKVFRKDIYIASNISFPEHVWYEDTTIFRCIILKCSQVFSINEPLYYYIQRKDSTTQIRNIHRMTRDIIYMLENLESVFYINNKYDTYYSEIEYIFIYSAIMYVGTEINIYNYKSAEQECLVSFIESRYKQVLNNKYLTNMQKNKLKVFMNRNYKMYYYLYGYRYKFRHKVKDFLISREEKSK